MNMLGMLKYISLNVPRYLHNVKTIGSTILWIIVDAIAILPILIYSSDSCNK